jgi:predicted porin
MTRGRGAEPLVAALMAMVPAVAHADATVTLSGIVDLALERGSYDRAVSATRVQSGVLSPSRFSVRATEDLGGGLQAFMVLETLVGADTGAAGAGGALWNRGSLVGLRGNAGQVALGRQYAPMFWVALRSDASTIAFANASVMLNLQHTAATGRSGVGGLFNNTVHYRTPDWHGWNAEVAYSLGNELAGARRRDGVNQGFNVQYAQGPWWVGYGDNRAIQHDAADRADRVQRTRMLGARYNGKAWGIGANALQSRNMLGGPAPGDARAVQLTARVAAGPGDVNLGAGWLAEGEGRRTQALHAGYVLPLSPRTHLYGYTVRLRNHGGAVRGLANLHGDYRLVRPGFDPHALALGMRHAF